MGKPVKRLGWREPRVIRKDYYPYPIITKWAHVVFAAVFIIFASLPLIIPREDEPEGLWVMPLMGILFGLLAGYAIPLLDHLAESTVSIGPSGVERRDSMLGNSIPILLLLKYRIQRWGWDEIGSCRLSVVSVGGRDHRILEFTDHGGELVGVVGLAKKLEEETVISCLSANGCEVEEEEPDGSDEAYPETDR